MLSNLHSLYVRVFTLMVNCVRKLLKTVLKADPIGAPAEKVAKAMEREGPGGNAFDKMPS